MRVYIAGILNSGNPTQVELENRIAMFYKAAEVIKATNAGWTTENPMEIAAMCGVNDGTCGPFNEHSFGCWLKSDLQVMLQCDGIVLLPDWDLSKGARLEEHVARQVGMELFYADHNGEVVA